MLKLYFLLGLIYPLVKADIHAVVQSNSCLVESIGSFTTVNCVDIRIAGELPLESKIPSTSTVVALHFSNSTGKIDESSFTNVNHVQAVYLDHCALSKFVLPNLPELRDLDIRNSFIPKIDKNSFKHSKNLKRIDLRTNKMVIEGGSFQDLNSLTFLDIEQQNVTLNEQFLKGLKNLVLLSITDSNILTISKDAFRDVPELVDLNLSSNPIEKIENGALDSLKKLKNMNILDTNINKIDVQLFKENSNFETLRASAKAVKNFDLRKFIKYCPRFYNFDFSLTDCGDSNIQDLNKKINDDNEFIFVYFDGIERPDRC